MVNKKQLEEFYKQNLENDIINTISEMKEMCIRDRSRPVLGVVVASMAVSTIFAVTPVLKQVSSGFMIIITTLLVAGLAAYFCPVEEKEEASHES